MKLIFSTILVLTINSYASTLILIGGGDRPKDALRILVKKTSSKKPIVILPWGTQYPIESFNSIKKELQSVGANNIVCLCNKDFSVNDKETLLGAGAIYFPGGNQNLVIKKINKYNLRNTFLSLYEKNIPIAGTSAGTAIQSELMLTGNGSETVLGLGTLKSFIVDQHFHLRQRQSRLLGALKLNSTYSGIGIDEDMSIVIYNGKKIMAIGPSLVTLYLKSNHTYTKIDLYNGDDFEL